MVEGYWLRMEDLICVPNNSDFTDVNNERAI